MTVLVIIGQEYLRHRFSHRIDKIRHILLEPTTVTGLKNQDTRTILVFEVVDITDILEARFVMIKLFQQMLDSRGASGADKTGDEYIVTGAFDVQAGPDGVDRSLLPDYPATGINII